ncbi:MAG TPA: LLM class flavin-dependent oxidoreductase [Usitatibacter sp.]|nr:LLM class flavin-dependent oxidoreductase [Usitatibacter sp.]
MKTLFQTPFSVLDLVTYPEGGTIPDAVRNSRELARHAERLGYKRYWVAEHHNLEGVASSATVVLMGYIAEGTQSIRVGSGGIMLPNHAPLVVAEQIGTLEAMYPGRIDLGLGRAPGTDQVTMRALRRGGREEDFGVQIEELESYFETATENQAVRAIPGMGIEVPVYILGSSLYSAHLAARLGRPYAFASHFAPGDLLQALEIYRDEFKPSKQLAEPYAIVGVPAFAAPTDEEAQFLASSMVLRSLSIFRGQRRPLPPPVERIEWSQQEQMLVAERMSLMVIGAPERVAKGLQQIIEATGADELIVVSDAFRHEHRMRSYELIMQSKGGAGRAHA